MNKLGFGLMRLPLLDEADRGSIDMEQTKQMVDAFLAAGFTYFDTAWMYHNFRSESAIKEALVQRYPRQAYTLATKLHAGYLQGKEDRDRIFAEQLRKTGVDYFDYYLLHDVNVQNSRVFERLDCFDWLAEKKRQGLIKHSGFSFHDHADYLQQVLADHPEVDFVQLQLNYLDWDSAGVQSRLCYEAACRAGKPVVVMEPVKGGTLARVPAAVEQLFRSYRSQLSPAAWAIRFAASLENVMMVLSGMSSLAQMEENIALMRDFQPLDAQEQQLIRQAVDLINADIAIPCTGCAYCQPGCPANIPISRYFSLYNADLQEVENKEWRPQGEYYQNLTQLFGKASDCLACGQCEQICPQHLPIIRHLQTVAAYFGS